LKRVGKSYIVKSGTIQQDNPGVVMKLVFEFPNPDEPEPNRKTKRESCSTGRGPKGPYTSQRLENEVSIKLPQEEVATFPHKYFSTRAHRN
jgi:hypothetical protein